VSNWKIPHTAELVATAHHASPVAPHTGRQFINQGQSTNAEAGPVQVKPYGGYRWRIENEIHAAGKSQTRHRVLTSDVTHPARAHRRPR
jgi:hypothetical protein